MYCPNCATEISTEQRYCRSCGLGLEKIAQSLVEQLPTRFDESLQQRKERIERWGVVALSVFGVGVLSIPLYQIVKVMIEGRVLAGLGFLAVTIMAACGLISVILFAKAKEVGESKTRSRPATPEVLPTTDTARNLLQPEPVEPSLSVTDATTELLYTRKEIRDQNR